MPTSPTQAMARPTPLASANRSTRAVTQVFGRGGVRAAVATCVVEADVTRSLANALGTVLPWHQPSKGARRRLAGQSQFEADTWRDSLTNL